MPERTVHVVFPGKDSRTLEELQVYMGYARELGRPVTASQAVRAAVRHLHRRFRRLSGGSGRGKRGR